MSAFGCTCPHAVTEHDNDPGATATGAHCTLCDCVITREQMLAFMKPPPAVGGEAFIVDAPPSTTVPIASQAVFNGRLVEVHERLAHALEDIAASLAKLATQQVMVTFGDGKPVEIRLDPPIIRPEVDK